MKSKSKMTKSLFVIAIVMCLNIAVVSPLFALLETEKRLTEDLCWYKHFEIIGMAIVATGAAIGTSIIGYAKWNVATTEKKIKLKPE
ncbi:MAG: hypothetical protein LBT18_03585 [Endomicrobium sp.]|jgi:hypothetical protein|nr:hypothetical protein [Endomicrobium sp.]